MKNFSAFLSKQKYRYSNFKYKVGNWDWLLIMGVILSLELTMFVFSYLNFYSVKKLNIDKNLELILTINGLFSAVLVSYFFNNISLIWSAKKEDYEEAILYSQKITDFRRVLKKLTEYYGIWNNEKATKNLLDFGVFKEIDYYDFKLMSFSDYKPVDQALIEKLTNHQDYSSGATDLYLGMVSLVKDRKSGNIIPDDELYEDYQRKGIYTTNFVDKCIDIGYFGRMWYWFNKDYDFINYNRLSKKSKEYIINALGRINTKYTEKNLDNKLMAEVCNDMQEFHLKELNQLLTNLKTGISGTTLIIFLTLISSLIFGVLLPFFTLFIIDIESVRFTLTNLLIAINFGLLFFFITNLYGFVKKQLKWA
jgi:hypothetical protein